MGGKVFSWMEGKEKSHITSNYLMSTAPLTCKEEEIDAFVGKLWSNMLETQLTIFDGGEPTNSRSLLQDRANQRQ